MKGIPKYILVAFLISNGCIQDRYTINYQKIDSEELGFCPEGTSEKPDIPSPALDAGGREVVMGKLQNGLYTWFDATVENGDTFDYKNQLLGKGNQLLADESDFPALAKHGIHTEKELANTKTITGRSVSQITIDGRPGRSSGAGFMADDETILSVIWQDNKTVKKLGMKHPDLARPLFHLWNSSRIHGQLNEQAGVEERTALKALVYNGHEITVKITGSRGWQESIFDDEILGSGQIEIWREMEEQEYGFLIQNYQQLSPDQIEELKKMISYLHTGEMVLFYINRYGFYEGHSDYRPDPLTIAFVFGLKSIEEIHRAADDDLYQYFTTHFTDNPE